MSKKLISPIYTVEQFDAIHTIPQTEKHYFTNRASLIKIRNYHKQQTSIHNAIIQLQENCINKTLRAEQKEYQYSKGRKIIQKLE